MADPRKNRRRKARARRRLAQWRARRRIYINASFFYVALYDRALTTREVAVLDDWCHPHMGVAS